MTIEEHAESARSFGLHFIHVDSVPESDMEFIGTLEEFFQALKLMGAAAVFVSTTELSEDLFTYQSIDDEDEGDEDQDCEGSEDTEEIDLCEIEPRLSAFKRQIGERGSFKFFGAVTATSLKFETREPWWLEFLELWSEAREVVESRWAAEVEEAEAAEEEKNEIVLAKLRQLIHDERFVDLSTQRAMRAYAIDKIPGLEEFADEVIRDEIQTLSAKISARGLKRR